MTSGDLLNAIQQLALESWTYVSEFGPCYAHYRDTLCCKCPVNNDYHGEFDELVATVLVGVQSTVFTPP